MRKIIAWEHKQFPFEKLDEDLNVVKNDVKLMIQDEEDEEVEIPTLMNTPWGLVAIDDTMNPYKHYEIRMGDTNFDLTPSICETITKEPGVEVFNKLGRYKFVIAIGRLFNFADIRRSLEQKICDVTDTQYKLSLINDDAVINNVVKLIQSLSSKKHMIYVFPNGNIEYSDETDKEFLLKLANLQLCEQLSGGIVFDNI